MANKGIFDSIENAVSELGEKLHHSDIGKQIMGKLDSVKSFDPSQIQTILNTLGQSADTKVQDAKQDLETVKHDGTEFAQKLKGYAAKLPELLKTLLPTLQGMLAKK